MLMTLQETSTSPDHNIKVQLLNASMKFKNLSKLEQLSASIKGSDMD